MSKIAFVSQKEEVDKFGNSIDVLEASYIFFLERLGFTVYPVSNFLKKPDEIFDLEGEKLLVLSGGGSVPNNFYLNKEHKREQINRDKTERKLLNEAIKRNIPVLAICRGMQFICGFYGGKIINLNKSLNNVVGVDHQVLCNNKKIYVNSFHNDGILLQDLPECLEIVAIDLNGVVEAFVHKTKKILALQWHPERNFKYKEGYEISLYLVNKYLIGGNDL